MSDPIDHPAHYADGWSNRAEIIDITERLNFNRGNAIKYLARAGRKSPDTELEDLRKAAWYVRREIQRIETDQLTERKDAHSGYQLGHDGAYTCICGHPARTREEWDQHYAEVIG